MLHIYINGTQYCVGVDCIILGPGEVIDVNCKICHARCKVERNMKGIRVKYADISGTGLDKTHDKFYCPKSEETWHKKGVKLYIESQRTESKRISELIKKDLDDLLNSVSYLHE